MKEKRVVEDLLSWMTKRHEEGTEFFSVRETFTVPFIVHLLAPIQHLKHEISFNEENRTCMIKVYQKKRYHEIELQFNEVKSGMEDFYPIAANEKDKDLSAIGAILVTRYLSEGEKERIPVKLTFPYDTAKEELQHMLTDPVTNDEDMMYEADKENFRLLIKIDGKFTSYFRAYAENNRH